MIPGINSRRMAQMMRRMGIQQVEILATEVIIKTPEKDIIITDPQVSKVNMMGQETFQITGSVSEKSKQEFSQEDIKIIIEKTGVSEEEAKNALKETGSVAEAIIKLKQ